jgi:hypothetical protein
MFSPIPKSSTPSIFFILINWIRILYKSVITIKVIRSIFIILLPCQLDITSAIINFSICQELITSHLLTSYFLFKLKSTRFMDYLSKKHGYFSFTRKFSFWRLAYKSLVLILWWLWKTTWTNCIFKLIKRNIIRTWASTTRISTTRATSTRTSTSYTNLLSNLKIVTVYSCI